MRLSDIQKLSAHGAKVLNGLATIVEFVKDEDDEKSDCQDKAGDFYQKGVVYLVKLFQTISYRWRWGQIY